MNTFPQINSSTIIRDLLTLRPETGQVFFRHGMACVGCSLSGFDTLFDAARNYGLTVEQLIEEITAAVDAVAE